MAAVLKKPKSPPSLCCQSCLGIKAQILFALAIGLAILPTGIAAQETDRLKYLALGDSYTIGESVAPEQRWPTQLLQLLTAEQFDFAAPEIVAKTGWTTDELEAAIDAQQLEGPFDLVTLLIGVNNQYRQRPVATYEPEFEKLLKRAIGLAGGKAGRVLVVSIPDYGLTPFAAKKFQEAPSEDSKFAARRIASELDAYNAAAQRIAIHHGAYWVDITGISRRVVDQAGMLAEDGLHPSGEMYLLWAKEIAPIAIKTLKGH